MGKYFVLAFGAVLFTASVNAKIDDSLFKEKKVKQAHQLMSEKYTAFAKLFNLCQIKTKAQECGKPYERLRSEYMNAKSTYDVIVISSGKAHVDLIAPAMMYPELERDLYDLKLISMKDTNNVDSSKLLAAVNQWQKQSQIEVTQFISLFDAIAIHIDAELRRNHD